MTYTFDMTFNTKKNNPSNNNNASKALDDLILSNIASMLGREKKETRKELNINFTPKTTRRSKKTIDIDITFPLKKTPKKPDAITFAEALMALMDTGKMDTYDFKLSDGTPIKFFYDEIQIGYDLYSIENGLKELSERMSEANKKKIIDIYINF